MLKRLFSAIKRGSRKIGQGGYTLIEVAAVVAITATLAAVVVPVAMEKVQEGKETSALGDCKAIGAAIASFNKDTGIWPAKSGATTTHFETLYTGSSSDNPTATTGWLTANKIDEMEDHLVVDNPPTTKYIASLYNWKGPYIESLAKKKDPWGHNYVVYVKALHTATSSTAKEYGWILSAGPDGKLDTVVTANATGGDDIGFYIAAAETGN